MASKRATKGHTGHTDSGSVRDIRVQRIGRVTIYKRGGGYYLYYRDGGKTVRRKVTGNLAAARVAASRTTTAIEEGNPSPFSFTRISIADLFDEFIEYCDLVRGLALRTVDRYRAALCHFGQYAEEDLPSKTADEVALFDVEDFVKWLGKQRRTRNGAVTGNEGKYSTAGKKFILGTCRTAFNWAKKRRHLPPYAENPFSEFGIESIRGREQPEVQVLTPEQQVAFFESCDDWQHPVFLMLAAYGLRVGELTHLLISDINMKSASFEVRSKPAMFWSVKTQRQRILPIPSELKQLFEGLMNGRKEGFLFMNREFAEGKEMPYNRFASRQSFMRHLEKLAERARDSGAEHERDVARAVGLFLREMGMIPEQRIRQEFMKVTKKIGCPELTRAHSLRHLFSTRVQEQGVNPFLVHGLLGHTTLDMTRRYTHFDMDAKRQAISQMLQADPSFRSATEED